MPTFHEERLEDHKTRGQETQEVRALATTIIIGGGVFLSLWLVVYYSVHF